MLGNRQYLNDGIGLAELPQFVSALAAARVGSASTSVLLWGTLPTMRGIAASNSATAGTRITISRAGVYMVGLCLTVPASGDIEIGIGRNVAATFTADPDLAAAGILVTQRVTAPASTSIGAMIQAPIAVTQAQAAAGVEVAFCASDGSASAPAAGDIVSANTTYWIAKIAKVA